MYRSILVPVDGSALSEFAIPFAIEIASHTGGQVRLLRVLSTTTGCSDVFFAPPPRGFDLVEAETRNLAASCNSSRASVSAELVFGTPFEEILRAAAASDLVVLSSHGRGGVARWILGSTSDRVIRLCSRHVLVIRPPDVPIRELAVAAAGRMYRDILVALDGSDLAEKALDDLRQLVPGKAVLHLVRIVSPALGTTDLRDAEDYLKRVGASFVHRGIPVAASIERSDNPAEEISAYAVRHGCGVIAMGTHGASGLTRWILGSVTDKVVRHGPVPVLVVRRGRPVWRDRAPDLGEHASVTPRHSL